MNIASPIVAKLGGTRRAAELLRLPPSTVQSWKVSGLIPAKHQAHIVAASAGAVSPADFFVTSAEQITTNGNQ